MKAYKIKLSINLSVGHEEFPMKLYVMVKKNECSKINLLGYESPIMLLVISVFA